MNGFPGSLLESEGGPELGTDKVRVLNAKGVRAIGDLRAEPVAVEHLGDRLHLVERVAGTSMLDVDAEVVV